uniref:Eukaryotic translation initiation factor 3 subunit G n=1 Tax=Franklinothrips vespiformis TaxID=297892 RepID=A0A481SZE0_FRAVS|nr:eukaryotic translation initiation factor 3 subunit G [Franklinothrips vespiformis]
MPVAEQVKSSWADEVEDETRQGPLPPSTEVWDNGFKIVTEYKYNDDDKKVKIVRTYKVEKRIVSKSIALRKTWPKFGASKNDKPGPDPATTIVSEDVYMHYLSAKEEENMKMEEDALEKLKANPEKGAVKCRTCNGEHWTSKCPYKGSDALAKAALDKKPIGTPGVPDKTAPTSSKYIPPSLRDGANKRGDSMNQMRRDDTIAIRMSNLSENCTETDLEELAKRFGQISKIYLAKDKATGNCKGFAYVHFRSRQSAAEAIQSLHGHGYDHLILNVDWSKPQASN